MRPKESEVWARYPTHAQAERAKSRQRDTANYYWTVENARPFETEHPPWKLLIVRREMP